MSSNQIISLKQKIQTSDKQLKLQRHSSNLSEDDIIRSRLIFEGDQSSDDRRILILIKYFNKSLIDLSLLENEKLFSLLYSIKHSYDLLKLTLQMDKNEQICYEKKIQLIYKKIKQLRLIIEYHEKRLMNAKQKRFNLFQYNQRIDKINKFNTRKELRTQQMITLERKRYFEHLQQTFETTYQQRLKQIAIYMRPIFELDDILQQDIHEDGQNEYSIEQQTTPTTPILSTIISERLRTYSDSSMNSIDGDENILTIRTKKSLNQNHLTMNSLSTLLINNQPQPLFSNDMELYGTQLVNPLLFFSSSLNT